MGATLIRCVGSEAVTAQEGIALFAQQVANGVIHRPEVHRDMRCIGKQIAVRIENRAGEIQTFLDVYRQCGFLQHRAHKRRDMHEPPVVDFQHDRVGAGRARGRICRCVASSGHQ